MEINSPGTERGKPDILVSGRKMCPMLTQAQGWKMELEYNVSQLLVLTLGAVNSNLERTLQNVCFPAVPHCNILPFCSSEEHATCNMVAAKGVGVVLAAGPKKGWGCTQKMLFLLWILFLGYKLLSWAYAMAERLSSARGTGRICFYTYHHFRRLIM